MSAIASLPSGPFAAAMGRMIVAPFVLPKTTRFKTLDIEVPVSSKPFTDEIWRTLVNFASSSHWRGSAGDSVMGDHVEAHPALKTATAQRTVWRTVQCLRMR
jgi:hypothetical protein